MMKKLVLNKSEISKLILFLVFPTIGFLVDLKMDNVNFHAHFLYFNNGRHPGNNFNTLFGYLIACLAVMAKPIYIELATNSSKRRIKSIVLLGLLLVILYLFQVEITDLSNFLKYLHAW